MRLQCVFHMSPAALLLVALLVTLAAAKAPPPLVFYYPTDGSGGQLVASSRPESNATVAADVARRLARAPLAHQWLVRHAAPMAPADVDSVLTAMSAVGDSRECWVARVLLARRYTYLHYVCVTPDALVAAFWRQRRDQHLAVTGADLGPLQPQIDFMTERHAAVDAAALDAAATRFPFAVTTVERLQVYGLRVGGGVQTTSVDWGLDRIDQRGRGRDYRYAYPTDAATTTLYMIDTGVYTAHAEFAPPGRALFVGNTIDGTDADCHGHGTHTASLAGGVTFGAAKAAPIRAIKVLDCAGYGTTASVVAGLEQVLVECNATVNSARHSLVVSLSLGGGYSPMMNDAVVAVLTACRAIVVVAAGNGNTADCTSSPASAPGALVVAATDANDARAVFSNYGACVGIAAPGVSIRGAALPPLQSTLLSGTSMATPLVAGIAAMALEKFPTLAAASVPPTSATAAVRPAAVRPADRHGQIVLTAQLPLPPAAAAFGGDTVRDHVVATATPGVMARPGGLPALPLVYSALPVSVPSAAPPALAVPAALLVLAALLLSLVS